MCVCRYIYLVCGVRGGGGGGGGVCVRSMSGMSMMQWSKHIK